ncbi:uncharacterized protein LOC115622410 [Scaptodrosophila lebanonensis]|uniref:Uncharacterized protein LOC115622410 n=1 Tax=Drosophila lebanonensis TaxID=7225 RepID=A0A6J2TAS0_DROLE|nr:uncharacterized protein LOC115622410 [Scaptodrosophila lebanonensis]
MPQSETFHRAVSKVLFISQIFALFPVSNMEARHVQDLRFRWLSARTFYSGFIMVLIVCEFGVALNYVSKVAITFQNAYVLLVFVVCLLMHIFFWRLAISWPKIMSSWQRVDELFLKVPYRYYNEYKMKWRINVVFSFVMISALVEHFLLHIISFHFSNMERTQCKINESFFESIYKLERPHLHMVLPYHAWLLPFLEWISLVIVYPRSFTDCFIMFVGIGLAKLHGRIAAVHLKAMPAIFWTEVRQHYLELKRLVRLVNAAIAPLVLLAFGKNMFFICFQLFNSFTNIGVDFILLLAFWYSLTFVVLRTMLTIFIASSITVFEKKISTALRDVPSRSWSTEVQRFSEQLGNDMTALSGEDFFFIRRQLFLAMATTIITYELMISDVINKGAIRQRTSYCKDNFLFLAQFFGVMPVSGVLSKKGSDDVRFRWFSLSLLVSVGLLIFTIFDCVLSSQVVLNDGLKIYTIGPLTFSTICIACFGVFLMISRQWPLIIQKTSSCELVFVQKCYANQLGMSFSGRIRLWGVVLLILAFGEHLTYFTSAVYNNQRQIQECNLTVDFWKNFYMRERPELLTVFSFTKWLIPLITWTTLSMTFVWNFPDIFLVLVCRATEIRFQQLHWRIKNHVGERMPNSFWQNVRLDLLNLSDLLKLYDKELSSLVLLSSTHNMYFLCVQIYHSFQIKGTWVDSLYFWFSLFHVVGRLLSMMVAASSIPLTVSQISYTLYEIPTDFWCLELKRLNEIICTDNFALSGKGFFFLTRRRIFGMAGTLMIYELVLINQMEGAQLEKNFCMKTCLRRGDKWDYIHNGSFQEAIRPVLLIAQIFALMPVRGIASKCADDLRFSWWSWRTVYAMIVIVFFGITSGFMVAFVTSVKFDFDSVETLIFYASIFFISLAFFQLAHRWPAVVVEWQAVESQLPELRTERERGALAQHIRMITLVGIMCSLVEHLLSMLASIYYVNACPVIPNQPIESFLYLNFAPIWQFMDYNQLMGILGKVVNVLATFAWSFNDIFVMAVSVSLASRFRQLNDYMQQEARQPTKQEYWIQCRKNFRNLCKLCDVVDDAISTITLLCFSNNLYFICGKILKSLQKKPSASHTLYFWFSLTFLLGRTLILSLYSASINDESKRPLLIFRCVPREYWCMELKRFSEEVHMDMVALTGMKFFRLTRGVVISVAGTIVTYELILLQFNKADKVNDCYEN